jgi:hypothetical protein
MASPLTLNYLFAIYLLIIGLFAIIRNILDWL